MFYYFTCDYPAVIKLNGLFLGSIFDTVKSIRVDDTPPFIEVCPTTGGYEQIYFLPDQNFLLAPSEYVAITDLNGGFLFHFSQPKTSNEFKVIAQEKCDYASITVFNDNGVKLSIESQADYFIEKLNFNFDSSTIDFFSISEHNFIALFTKGNKNILSVYHVGQTTSHVFRREIDAFTYTDGLKTTVYHKDIQKHKVISEWNFIDNAFIEKSRFVEPNGSSIKTDFSTKILPYAFIEELLVGGDYALFTGGIIKDNANKLKGYFGDFIGVMPPPAFRSINQVGLIYKDTKNRYSVKYFTFTIENNKITGIHPAE